MFAGRGARLGRNLRENGDLLRLRAAVNFPLFRAFRTCRIARTMVGLFRRFRGIFPMLVLVLMRMRAFARAGGFIAVQASRRRSVVRNTEMQRSFQ